MCAWWLSFGLLLLAVGAGRSSRASVPHLVILPASPVEHGLRAEANKPYNLNCLGRGGDARLFSSLTWYNPRGEKMDRLVQRLSLPVQAAAALFPY